MAEIRIEKTTHPKEKPDSDKLSFGKYFTDHMFVMNYEKGKGWFDPRVVPFAPFEISPAAMVLHYAPEIFEGLKAYRTPDGTVQLFRPQENIDRMNRSAERMCLPQIDPKLFMEGLLTLVKTDQDWVPSGADTTLYIRPFLFATDEKLGVHAPSKCTFAIILSPVGPYFPEGVNPVKIFIEKEDVRAVRGGTGFAKCGGNYAGSLRAGERAEAKGFAQVLWLDGVEKKYVEEGGGMNIMFKIKGKVVTPALLGTVLPGITRKSVIEMLKSWGVEVEERLVTLEEILEGIKNGDVEEAWCTGTGAVISPIGEFATEDETYPIGEFKSGPLALKLYHSLTDLQFGRSEDKFGWTVRVAR